MRGTGKRWLLAATATLGVVEAGKTKSLIDLGSARRMDCGLWSAARHQAVTVPSQLRMPSVARAASSSSMTVIIAATLCAGVFAALFLPLMAVTRAKALRVA